MLYVLVSCFYLLQWGLHLWCLNGSRSYGPGTDRPSVCTIEIGSVKFLRLMFILDMTVLNTYFSRNLFFF